MTRTLQEILAGTIKQSRVASGMQQHELAALVGLTRTSISNIELGKQALSVELFCKIAEHLKKNPGEMLNRSLQKASETDVSIDDVEDPKIRQMISNVINQ